MNSFPRRTPLRRTLLLGLLITGFATLAVLPLSRSVVPTAFVCVAVITNKWITRKRSAEPHKIGCFLVQTYH
jgi:hypothetical protein